jgi:hypothetical protein
MDITIPCACPTDGQTRHPDGDTVTLMEPLDFRTRQAIRRQIVWVKETTDGFTSGEVFATLDEMFLLLCITGWTLLGPNDKGKIGPLPPSRENIAERFMGDDDRFAMPILRKANEMYQDVILLPLLAGASTSSPGTPTDGSTSPKNGTTPRRKPSKRSSISTIPMVVTGPTQGSLDGGSNSSPS